MACIRIRPDVGDPLTGDHGAERHQRQAEFSNTCQQTVELRLVGDLTGERRPTGIAFEAHVPEGCDESIAQFAFYHELVCRHSQSLRYGRADAITPPAIHPG